MTELELFNNELERLHSILHMEFYSEETRILVLSMISTITQELLASVRESKGLK